MENYLATATGDGADNISITEVREAIKWIQIADEEHGAFWVSVIKEDENVLEVDKGLYFRGIFEDNPDHEYQKTATGWQQAEWLFAILLSGDMDTLKNWFDEK